jgi:hypothetical protein
MKQAEIPIGAGRLWGKEALCPKRVHSQVGWMLRPGCGSIRVDRTTSVGGWNSAGMAAGAPHLGVWFLLSVKQRNGSNPPSLSLILNLMVSKRGHLERGKVHSKMSRKGCQPDETGSRQAYASGLREVRAIPPGGVTPSLTNSPLGEFVPFCQFVPYYIS